MRADMHTGSGDPTNDVVKAVKAVLSARYGDEAFLVAERQAEAAEQPEQIALWNSVVSSL